MSRLRILVVEDNPYNAELAREILGYRGHEVVAAADRDEFRKGMAQGLPDLVLMDIALRGADGEELLRELRENPEWRAIRVVAVTANAMSGERERLLEAGFDGYLSKPIDPWTFGTEVEALAVLQRVAS